MSDDGRSPPSRGTTRRRVLVASAAAASALAIARLLRLSFSPSPERPKAPRPVALVGCGSYEASAIRAGVERGFALAPPPDVRGKRVLLKPNFVEFSADRPVTTHVELIRATIRAFRDLGAAEIVVGEGPGHNPDTSEVWTRSGLFALGAEERVPIVDLNVDDMVRRRMHTFAEGDGLVGRRLEWMYVPRTLLAADVLVSMPKLKTHHWAGLTLGMKNLFGVVPSARYGWPKNWLHMNGIERSIVELAASFPVAYTIADGVVGMEGDGPIMGTAVPSSVLVFGRSVFDVDWIGARLMGFEPAQIGYLQLAAAAGLGVLADPPTTGESVRTMERKFVVPPRFDALRG